MGRLSTVTDQASNPITTATYDFAGHLLSVDGQGYTYNNLFQLTPMCSTVIRRLKTTAIRHGRRGRGSFRSMITAVKK